MGAALMSFIFDTNIFVVGGNVDVPVFHLKQLLKTAGWTVPRSSDGFVYNPAGDQITVVGAGPGGLANSNAWFIVRSPDGHSWKFAKGVVATPPDLSAQYWAVSVSRAAGFTGGSPSVTVPPTAADEGIMTGVGTTLTIANNTDCRYNIAAESVAPYRFWAAPLSNTQSNNQSVFMMDTTQGSEVSVFDADPFVYVLGFSGFTLFGYTRAGTPQERFGTFSLNTYVDNQGSNQFNGKDDLMAVVYISSSRGIGAKGTSSMVRATTNDRRVGTTLKRALNGDIITITNKLVVPWDGSLPRRDA